MKPEILIELCRGYDQRESAMPCGLILREALKHEGVAVLILYDESGGNGKVTHYDRIDFDAVQTGEGIFWKFFTWIDEGAFELTTDAFNTFRVSINVMTSLYRTG